MSRYDTISPGYFARSGGTLEWEGGIKILLIIIISNNSTVFLKLLLFLV